MKNDIALINTEAPIEFSDVVKPIRLGAFYAENGAFAVASGLVIWFRLIAERQSAAFNCSWGYETYPGKAASNLQYMEVEVVGLDECRKRLSTINAAKIFNTSLCAQAKETGGACK